MQKSQNVPTGGIIEVKFEKDAITALNQIIDKQYIQIFPPDIQKSLYIGLNVSKEKKSTTEFQF